MKLYALCDEGLLQRYGKSLEEFVAIAKREGAEVIQYRDKRGNKELIKKRLIALRALYDGYLIINDYYDLAPFCDGVHLGQEDMASIDPNKAKAIKLLRKSIGADKILGLSTHSKEEVLEANGLDLNYIGLGAYRATSTKEGSLQILGDKLDSIAAHSRHLVAAIGGVRRSDRFKNVHYLAIGSGLLA